MQQLNGWRDAHYKLIWFVLTTFTFSSRHVVDSIELTKSPWTPFVPPEAPSNIEADIDCSTQRGC
jgi:hypothetical protein